MQKLCYKLSILFFIRYISSLISDVNICLNTQERFNVVHQHEVKKLGKGGFGIVYGDSQYAVKTINITSRSQYVMFKNEMRFMLTLGEKANFMSVVPQMCVYSREQKQKTQFPVQVKITMDKMIGDLNYVTTKLDIPEQENPFWHIDMAFQMVATLETLHNSNALHLDIKPDNILFMNIYTPVISDFGLSARKQAAAQKQNQMGTTFYMGYETLQQNPPSYTEKADIYAMGLTLIELFQLRPLQQKIASLSKIPKAERNVLTQYFKDVLNSMILYYYPQKRLSTRKILIHLLKGLKVFDRYQQQGDYDLFPQSLDEYIEAQAQHYTNLKNSNDPVTLKYYDQLMTNLDKRAKIYFGFITSTVEDDQGNQTQYTIQQLMADLNDYTKGEPQLNQYFDQNLQKKFIDEKEVAIQIDEPVEESDLDEQILVANPNQNADLQYNEQDEQHDQKILAMSPEVPDNLNNKNDIAFPSLAGRQRQPKKKNKIQKMNQKQQQRMINIYGVQPKKGKRNFII